MMGPYEPRAGQPPETALVPHRMRPPWLLTIATTHPSCSFTCVHTHRLHYKSGRWPPLVLPPTTVCVATVVEQALAGGPVHPQRQQLDGFHILNCSMFLS